MRYSAVRLISCSAGHINGFGGWGEGMRELTKHFVANLRIVFIRSAILLRFVV